MDEHTANKIIEATHKVRWMAAFALCMLGIFLLFAALGELKGLRYIGSGITATDTITVSGEGKVSAVPDTAEFSVTVQDTAADVATAQSKATTSGNAIINYLEQQGVDSTDIQTTDYEINPQYSYSQAACPVLVNPMDGGSVSSGTVYCPPSGKQVLTGYQVSQTLSVKVTDTTKAGTLLSGVGKLGASQVSGLTFTVSNETQLQDQARQKAIADAQTQAQTLAKQLGVSLVRIVNYNENQGGNAPVPMMAMAAGSSAASAPQIPTGQNTITSDVSITYEIQ
jgi:uncharacterized protein YggE